MVAFFVVLWQHDTKRSKTVVTGEEKQRVMNPQEEYQYFLREYLLPIIGISRNNNVQLVSPITQTPQRGREKTYIRQEDNTLFFSNKSIDLCFIKDWPTIVDKDTLAIGEKIIGAFMQVSQYYYNKGQTKTRISYASQTIRTQNYRLAIQKGVCDWVSYRNEAFYELLQNFEEWSVRTYEGKKVTYGFIFDPHASSTLPENSYGKWLDFVSDDYSATLTDCIHSVIRLDSNCNFSEYISLTEDHKFKPLDLSSKLPYRFAQIIQTYVVDDCIGVFLLSNGDIILSKNQKIQLIKRNLQWLNFSYDAFANTIDAKAKSLSGIRALLPQIYASTLDVSFAHTGGIIAVITDASKLGGILSQCDNLLNGLSLEEIGDILKREEEKKKPSVAESPTEEEKGFSPDIKKRLFKRAVIQSLIQDQPFKMIDRKLRTELISMDGACILSQDGRICSVGAIIQNDSGSSGGGRSAAAKKLSNFGLAIKISTDGYIELFVNNETVYCIR